jgi:hypothetical protein
MTTPKSSAAVIQAALADFFPPADLHFKAQVVKGNKALAVAFLDARTVMDRLDQVLGLEGWNDDYTELGDGTLLCRLKVRIGRLWITRCGVGALSDQPDAGDRKKAAESDALKRAAVKFGVGRYLYRLPPTWLGYDPQGRKFTEHFRVPTNYLPVTSRPTIDSKGLQAVNGNGHALTH